MDIGGTQYRLALIDKKGKIRRLKRGNTLREEGAQWMIDRLLWEGERLLKWAGKPVGACGIGFGGPVDFECDRRGFGRPTGQRDKGPVFPTIDGSEHIIPSRLHRATRVPIAHHFGVLYAEFVPKLPNGPRVWWASTKQLRRLSLSHLACLDGRKV